MTNDERRMRDDQRPTNLRRGLLLKLLPAIWLLGLLVGLGACGRQPASPPTPTSPPAPTVTSPPASATPGLILTAVPGIAATITAVSKLPPLSPQAAAPYLALYDLVRACNEFHPNRRATVERHLQWLVAPAQTPADLVAFYGDEVSSQLVFGAAYMVAVEWKIGGRVTDSCLIPIGEQFNVLLVGLGREALPEFATP